jgi:hypothetical protein
LTRTLPLTGVSTTLWPSTGVTALLLVVPVVPVVLVVAD